MIKLIKLTSISLILLLMVSCSIHEQHAFYLENAELYYHVEHKKHQATIFSGNRVVLNEDNNSFSTTGHSIQNGKGLVIAFRDYYANRLKLDSSGFQKISIHLSPNSKPSNKIFFKDNPEVIGFVSAGSSSFSEWSPIGYIDNGYIEFNEISDDQIKIDTSFDIVLLDFLSKDHSGDRTKHIEKTLILEKKSIETISPWEGKLSKNLQAALHPERN